MGSPSLDDQIKVFLRGINFRILHPRIVLPDLPDVRQFVGHQ